MISVSNGQKSDDLLKFACVNCQNATTIQHTVALDWFIIFKNPFFGVQPPKFSAQQTVMHRQTLKRVKTRDPVQLKKKGVSTTLVGIQGARGIDTRF